MQSEFEKVRNIEKDKTFFFFCLALTMSISAHGKKTFTENVIHVKLFIHMQCVPNKLALLRYFPCCCCFCYNYSSFPSFSRRCRSRFIWLNFVAEHRSHIEECMKYSDIRAKPADHKFTTSMFPLPQKKKRMPLKKKCLQK